MSCANTFSAHLCFGRRAVIFATAHCPQGFRGRLYLTDLLARVKTAFFQQPLIAAAIHFNTLDQLWKCYIQIHSKQKASSPSSLWSCPFQEVKSQVFLSAQAPDFHSFWFPLWPAALGLFQNTPTLALPLEYLHISSTLMSPG